MTGEVPAPAPRRSQILMLAVFLLLCSPFAYWPIKLWWAGSENRKEYASRKDRYDAIARKIAGLKLEPGALHRYQVSQDLNPDTLQDPGPYEESHFELIRASREPDQTLVIQIPTRDFGHLGCYWLYYIQPSPTAESYRRFFSQEQKVHPVGTGWYAVYDPQ